MIPKKGIKGTGGSSKKNQNVNKSRDTRKVEVEQETQSKTIMSPQSTPPKKEKDIESTIDSVSKLSAFTSQGIGFMASVLLLSITAIIIEGLFTVNGIGVSTVWRVLMYTVIAIVIAKYFFMSGLEDMLPAGWIGLPRVFGSVPKDFIYDTGRHWTLPGKGNTMDPVDMRSQQLDVVTQIFSKDSVKMKNLTRLNFKVYDPYRFVMVKDFKNTLETIISNAFLTISSDQTASEILAFNKDSIIGTVKDHLEKLPENGSYKITDFGIEIQPNTIACEGFEFLDQKTKDAYESKAREKKERKGETVQFKHYLKLAKKLTKNDEIELSEALIRIMQLHGKNAPDEKLFRIAGIDPEVVKNVLDFFKKSKK